MTTMNFTLCVLTLNASKTSQALLSSLAMQTVANIDVLVIDTSSNDATLDFFKAAHFRTHLVTAEAFNHGATRQLAVELSPNADIIIFMTQDASLATPSAIRHLLNAFNDPKVGAAYGRQLQAEDATPIAAHARLFNYPSSSYVRSKEDIPYFGIKTSFMSNSFAAYRRSALMETGGFPPSVILSEDTMVAAKMLQAGWKLAYCADATCFHSHNYSMIEEFKRYFDIGVFHGREPWYLKTLGTAEGEGLRFVRSELRYLQATAPALIPSALLRTLVKFCAYRLGRLEKYLPLRLKRLLSMNKGFWHIPTHGPDNRNYH